MLLSRIMSVSTWRVLSFGLVPTLLSVAWAAEDAATSKTVKLTATPVQWPAAVMTPSVIQAADKGGFQMQIVTKTGVVLPMQRAAFAKGQAEQVVSLGGVNLTFLVNRDNQTFALKPEKGNPVVLKKQGDGLTPTVVPLADKRKLPVAFPFASVSKLDSFFVLRAATTAKGSLDGEQIGFLDDDLDGKIDTSDVFTLGAACAFAPISKQVATKKGVWTIDAIAASGDQATFSPDAAATVPLTFVFTGESQGHAAISSEDGSLTTVVTGAKDVLKLPPGNYKLLHGVVVDGKGKVMAAVIPGELPAYTLASDGADAKKKPIFAYGGPFKLGFKARMNNGKLAVDPYITLAGAGGERYLDYRWQGPPTVYVNGKQNGSMGFG